MFPFQGKKKTDSVLISTPRLHSAIELTEEPETPPAHKPANIPDYEELPDSKPFQAVTWKAIENEYVPSPQNSPRFDAHRTRAHTISDCHSTPEVTLRHHMDSTFTDEDSPASLHRNKHLSLISMESGLSFGYDVEKDFNPSLPLESQPWYHGKVHRAEAEALIHEDGDFLVRENVTMPDTYTLSMRWRGGFDHTLISTTEVINSKCNGGRSVSTAVKYHFDGGAFDSIPELIYNHLKYQIPIDKDSQNVISNPVCKGGSRGPPFSYGPEPENSPTGFSTLPKNFGSKQKKRSASPEPPVRHHNTLRSTRSVSFSPNNSNRSSPAREHCLRATISSGDLLDDREPVEVDVRRNVISPPPRYRAMTEVRFTSPPPSFERARAASVTSPTSPRGRLGSWEDYEVMGSVSILGSPPLPRANFGKRDVSSTAQREPVKYAEIRYPGKKDRSSPTTTARKTSVPSMKFAEVKDYSSPASATRTSSVKYAEVRFVRPRDHHTSNATPHPFSLYDTVPTPYKNTNPYQSRAEILAQKLQSESTYATPKPNSHQGLTRMESTPHPFSHYVTVHPVPRQNSTPAMGTPRTSTVPIAQTDTTMYSLPHKPPRNRVSTLVTERTGSGLAILGHASSTRVLKGLPGYDALVKLQALLGNYTNEELAYHLTKADAVSFLLAPRPGEDDGVWKNR